MTKILNSRQSSGSMRSQFDSFSRMTGRWTGRSLFPILLLLLVGNPLLADDKQAAEGSTKASSEYSQRLQRILKNELPRDAEDLRVMQKHIQG
ncbi:MAG: hypothetical protein OSB47_10385, partial [Pirellulaceae bacterium]|nr:hypothetical protein [Pirellulaceae bacterium]